MSIRKREWTNASGDHEAWQICYTASDGKRRTETFAYEKEAKERHAEIIVEMKKGTHTPKSTSITIAEAGELWIKTAEGNKLERSTITDYKNTLRLHINPFIGPKKLSELSAPMVRAFEDTLKAEGRSPAMVRRTRTYLSQLLGDAMERGLVNRNVARGLKRTQEAKAARRQKGKLEVGVDIPTVEEINAILAVLKERKGRWRPLLLTATFCGLRGSELRGLRWEDVDFAKSELHVRQRADRYNVIGRPKSEAGKRTVPVPASVMLALKEWRNPPPVLVGVLKERRLACPQGPLGLVFPNGKGRIESHGDVVTRGWQPAQVAAGVVGPDGRAKYKGLHALRHFFASWCINRSKDGGRELPAKVVQGMMGHSSIKITLDVYGHLFPSTDNSAELAMATAKFSI